MTPVDVVVVSYNSANELRACVQPLALARGCHVVVVDSASGDGSLGAVAGLPVTTIPLPVNRGFAHGCNAGLRHGTAPYVLLLNPDAVIPEAGLRSMAAILDTEPAVGAVAPRILEADGTVDWSQRRFPRLRSTFAQALFLHRLLPRAAWTDELVRDPAAYAAAASPEWASGACLLVRRSVLEALGGLDDGFFLYCEDMDLCRRIRDAGHDIRYTPDAVCRHLGGASAPRAALLPVLAASRVRYARKHQPAPKAVLERAGVVLGGLTHAALTTRGRDVRRGNLRAAARALTPQRPGDGAPS